MASELAQVKQLAPGESAGYGRHFVASEPTWIGVVPVGYGDGFRRDLTGTEVRVAGELRPVVGTVSMDAFTVSLDRAAAGHAGDDHRPRPARRDARRVAGTINYEITCGIVSRPARARRTIFDG